MKDKVLKILIAQVLPIVAGAIGGWLMIQFPAAYQGLCSARLI